MSIKNQSKNASYQNKNSYQFLLKNLSQGFALHKIITNKNGKPVDYIFIEVNKAFEKLTGLSKKKLIGNKVTDVIPGINKDPVKWIEKYGKVALTQESIKFENYSTPLKKWYSIKAYSPEKNYFVSIFKDISEEKNRLKDLYNTVNSGIAIYSVINNGKSGKDYIVEDFNKKALELEGKTRSKVIGKSLYDLRPNIDEYGLIPEFRKVWKTGTSRLYPSKIYTDKKFSSYYENRIFKLPNNNIVVIYDDVTERKNSEDKLKESEKKFKSYIDNSPEGVFITDAKGDYIDINTIATKLTGYSKKELLKMNIIDLVSPDTTKQTMKNFLELKKTGQIFMEMPYVTKKNKKGYWLINAVKLSKDKYMGYVTDITERKKIENELKESEEKYHSLISNIPAVIWKSGIKGNTIYISPKIKEIYGYTSDEIIKSNEKLWFGRIHPDDVDRVKKDYSTFFNKNDKFKTEYRIKRKDGKWIWLRDTGNKVTKKDKLSYSEGFFVDITKEKKGEQKLKENENKLNLIINTSPIGICTVDTIGNFVTTNLAYEQILGYTKKELMKMSFFDVTHPDDRPKNKKLFQNMFSLDTVGFSMEKKYIRKGGKEINVSVHAIGIKNTDGNIEFGTAFVEDITEKKKSAEDLKKNDSRYKKAQEMGHVGNWEYNPNTTKFWASEEAKRIYGYNSNDISFSTEKVEKCVVERERVHQALIDLIKHNKKYDLEFEIITNDKNIRKIIHSIAETKKNVKGNPIMVTGVIIDITKRKKTEEKLKNKVEELEKFQKLTIGRELKMIELKEKIEKYEEKNGN